MKQILQNLRSGELLVEDIPSPAVKPGHLLIRTTRSLISAGTERMLVDFGKAGFISKAKQQPEKVKQVLDKVRTDGLISTMETIFAKLGQPIPLGYCNVGKVIQVGDGMAGFKRGDRIVSNGRHAEIVCVPEKLCVKIPDEVDDERAAFTVISSIALQGVRLLNPTLGESISVFGLGLIGLIAVQILKANGCRVIGFDYDSARVELAKSFGINSVDLSTGVDPIQVATSFSNGQGVDGVLIAASTKSSELMHQAAQMSRKRGRIILTGVAGLDLRRSDYYQKELSLQVSCSYGPGRYDPSYEGKGNDYPIGFVRWTEQRNFEAILELLKEGSIQVGKLISKRTKFIEAVEAYNTLSSKSVIGIILQYESTAQDSEDENYPVRTINVSSGHPGIAKKTDKVVIGVIGAGNYTVRRLLPALRKSSATLKIIASSQGVSGTHAAKKFGFLKSTTDYKQILNDKEINSVFITTRHSSHALMTIEALKMGKNVFVEKPLCIKEEELEQIIDVYNQVCSTSEIRPILMVGFNRRFSPLTKLIHEKITGRVNPLSMIFTCNAGAIPPDHWAQDPEVGGGRIVGEAVHFIDTLRFIAGSPIVKVSAFKHNVKESTDCEDSVAIILGFADGSIGNINYYSGGSKSYPKERMEVFVDNKNILLDNFKEVTGYGFNGFNKKKLWSQDKGHENGFLEFINGVKNGSESPMPFAETTNVTRASFAVLTSMRTNKTITLL